MRHQLPYAANCSLLFTEVPLLARIPLVPELREGGDTGHPIVVADPDSEASQAFQHLAKVIEDDAPRRRYHPELTIS